MNLCYLSLGSNQRSPERQLRCALNAIQHLPNTSITKTSSFYWSKAWGLSTQQDFCNLVIEIRTRLEPKSLLRQCQQIEKHQGRVRKKKWGPRTLDIDIILYAERRIRTKELTIPHPYCGIRDFVIIPLLEINPAIPALPPDLCNKDCVLKACRKPLKAMNGFQERHGCVSRVCDRL